MTTKRLFIPTAVVAAGLFMMPFAGGVANAAPARAAPTVVATTPVNGATDVAVTATPSATFNVQVASPTVSLTTSTGAAVTVSKSYDSATKTVTITPTSKLGMGVTYIAAVKARDAQTGVTMKDPYKWSFTTGIVVRPVDNDCSAGTVAFTFDDGPDTYTPQVIAMLKALNLKGTFFVIGKKVDGSTFGRQTVQQEYQAGLGVQNHTYDHVRLSTLTDDQIRQELDNASNAVVAAGVAKPTLYRPPFGDITPHADKVAYTDGYRIVMSWGMSSTGNIIDSGDWIDGITVDEIVRNVTVGYTDPATGTFHPGMKPNAIIAMHDGSSTATPKTLAALQGIVDYMNANHLCSTATIREDATGGVVPVPAPPIPETGNLVHNPSLETMYVSGGVTTDVPEGFERSGYGTNTYTWTTTSNAHTGSVAERVDVTAWTSGDRKLLLDRAAGHASYLPTVTPGSTYSMWVWYAGTWTTGTGATSVSLVTYYRTGSGTTADPYVWRYWQESRSVPPDVGWSLAYFKTAPLPAAANAVSFGMLIHGVGTLITDDYTMVQN